MAAAVTNPLFTRGLRSRSSAAVTQAADDVIGNELCHPPKRGGCSTASNTAMNTDQQGSRLSSPRP